MAEQKYLVDINLNQNELKKPVLENQGIAPENPKDGQIYYATNTGAKGVKVYKTGATSAWKKLLDEDDTSNFVPTSRKVNNKALSSDVTLYGTDITLSSTDTTTTLTAALENCVVKNATITGTTKCKITYDSQGLVTAGADLQASDIPNLTTTKINALTGYTKGSSSAALTTTDTLNQALSKLENQVDTKVTANSAITGATKCKITYDSKGLVTAGADLSASDIPSITLSKISDVTATATEVNVLDGVTVTTADINSIPNKIELSSLSIDSSSTNYLGYDSTTGKISAKVDTTVTENSNKLITSGAVSTAISTAIAGVIVPKGSISSTSSLPTLVKAHVGWMYNFSASFTTTSDFVEGAGIEYPAGTNVVIVEYETNVYKYDVFSGFVDTSSFITASSTDTLTNKTIDADDNTISDLTLSNLKSGVLQTSVRAAASASDTAIVSEKAVRTELDLKAPLASPALTGTPTAPTAATGTNTTQVATTAFVQDAIATASLTLAANNTALTQSGGVCTWTITNTLNNADVICSVREVSSGEEVGVNITYTASTITIKINSSSNISAGTYRAVIIGQKVSS